MSPSLVAARPLTSVAGFRAMGVSAGIKSGNRADVALLVNDGPHHDAAAVFTQNAFAGAPVHVSRQHIADGVLKAIVVNSGNANACTGRQGLRDALSMARTTAECMDMQPEDVLVCSTGRIGIPMPMEKVLPGIRAAAERLDEGVDEIANAILTTDSGPKHADASFTVDGVTCTLAGIAKGAGMIHPNMATMLSFLVTDAHVPSKHLRTALHDAVSRSFNQVSVDGDESTNDTCAILASGASGTTPLDPKHPDWEGFLTALLAVTQRLASRIAADGEGATKLMRVDVVGAETDEDARKAARAVCSSDLVKSAMHGEDPNWGRIVSAVGQSRIPLNPTDITLEVGDMKQTATLLDHGEILDAGEAARALLAAAEIRIRLDLHRGNGHGSAWGCDLTPDYVTFNSAYTT